MQTQTSNTLHNAIIEAGSKDRPPMLAPGWKEKFVLDSEGNPTTITERVFETYKNVSQDIRDQLNAKAKAVQIILTWIDNDIYSTVDDCPNACEMWKAIERLKQVYHPQTHPTHYNQNSSTGSQQAATGNRGKVIVNSPQPIYDQEPSMVDDDDKTSKDKEIDKLMALISLSFKKIYKPTNNNLRTSSNISRANQDNSPWIHKNAGYEHQRLDDTDDESDDQELEAHYMYMAKLQQVSLDVVDSGPIFDTKPEQKDDHYDIDQNDEDADLAKERELLASLIEKLKCKIDETKNRNTLLETSNKVLVEKLKNEIEDIKNKNKSLTEANNKLSKENDLLYADFKKSKAELKRRDSIEYASEMELACAKVRVQTMNMLNNKCRTSFAKLEFLKKVKQANPRLYDIGFYNDNLALMLSPESDEVIRFEKKSRSKLSDLVRPFDYAKLNSLYDLFVPQCEKSSEQRYFLERSRISHINVQNEKKKEYFQKQTTFLEKRMDDSIS
nr:hypothetical protein [Tanacetum cinerariifolium]